MPESAIVVAVSDAVRRAQIASALSRAGYDVIEAPIAAAAIALAPRADLLLIGLDGPQAADPLIRRLRADPTTSSVPMIRLDPSPVEGAESDIAELPEDVPLPALIAVIRATLRARRGEERVRTLARQWRSTFDAIRDGICLVDLAGRVLRCNVALATMVGKPIPDLIGRDSSELFKGWNAAEGANDGLARVKASRRRETDLVRRDARYFQHVVDPVFDEEGSLSGAVRIVSEVTDRKRLEDELRERAEELSRVNRMKDEFLATVSHELRTPLHAMMGWIGLLRGGRLARSLRTRAMETIERNTQAQARLVEDLLDMSRIISGKLRLETRPVALAESIEAAIDALKPTAEAKGVKLAFSCDRTSSRILGDPDRLQQIVWNLLSNAIKFTPAGAADPRIEVRLEQGDTHARVTVSDHGAGIDPEFLPYVFDRFRQADGTSTRRHGGLGLGLAIVRHLVELHGGTVQVESHGRGSGATFAITFPLLVEAVHEAEARH